MSRIPIEKISNTILVTLLIVLGVLSVSATYYKTFGLKSTEVIYEEEALEYDTE